MKKKKGTKALKKNAFTLAEVLITLAIIGVVSALVIPSVLKNYNDKKYNTARLKALKTFGEAGKMASINGEINGQPSARAFVENVLSKYLKIVKICDKAQECGFPEKFKSSSGYNIISDDKQTWKQIGDYNYSLLAPVNDVLMSTVVSITDGFVAKVFYNPKCVRSTKEVFLNTCIYNECWAYSTDTACLNIVYDMNGFRGPNHVGEDIGIVTTFWSGLNATSVAPGIISYNDARAIYNEGYKTQSEAQTACAEHGTSKISYALPNMDELASLFINKNLTSLPANNYMSASPFIYRSSCSWRITSSGYRRYDGSKSYAWCIHR